MLAGRAGNGHQKDMNIHSSTTFDTLTKLLGTVVLIEEVVSDLLQIRQVTVEESRPDRQEVRVARVVDLDNTPGVLASSDLATTDLNDVLRANNGERHEPTEFGVLLDSVLVVLLDIVREVVNGDSVVLNILHDQLLGLGQLTRRQGISATNHGDDVDAGRKALHQLDVEFAETVDPQCVSNGALRRRRSQLTYP